jgi:hypothetical protein
MNDYLFRGCIKAVTGLLKHCAQSIRIMIRRTATILLFLLLRSFAFGQVCGGSFNVINFFVLNGSKADIIKYEVLPLDDSHLKNIFLRSSLDSGIKVNMWNNLINGVYLRERHFDPATISDIPPFKDFHAAVNDLADDLNEHNKRHGYGAVKVRGIVTGGRLTFPTKELYSQLFLLKITCNRHVGIYIVDLFGACGKNLNLIYNSYNGFEEYINAGWRYIR